jgi:hypothetical protein
VDNLGFSLFLSRDGMSCYRNLLSLYSECAPSITFIPENTRNSRFLLSQSWNGVCCFPSELWVRWRCKIGFVELKWLVTFAAGGHGGIVLFRRLWHLEVGSTFSPWIAIVTVDPAVTESNKSNLS